MANTDELRLRPFAVDDIQGACALNAEAGWNQVAADWRFMAEAGQGVAVDDANGRLIGTGMVLPYGGRFAWIAMILVTRSWQRRGVATLVMRHCLETCARQGLVAGLDATEQGRPVYLPLGFRDVYALSRFAVDRVVSQSRIDSAVRPMRADELAAVAAYDAAIFGCSRVQVLQHLHRRQPDLALLVDGVDGPAGFILGRDGRVATQIGPLVASDEQIAASLLSAALSKVRGPVFLDLADRHEALRGIIEAAGFRRQRGYVRMLLDRDEPLDDPARGFIITGPEFA